MLVTTERRGTGRSTGHAMTPRRGIRLLGTTARVRRLAHAGGASPTARGRRAIADALGLERLAVWGISGGGPHALGSRALLGGRVVAVASLAAVGPLDAEGLDWLAGMGEDNIEEFGAAQEGRDALERYRARSDASDCRGTRCSSARSCAPSSLPSTPLRSPASSLSTSIESMRGALDQASRAGSTTTSRSPRRGASTSQQIGVPVLLWHGEHDLFVPIAHGRWLAERLPNVDARLGRRRPPDPRTRRIPEVHAWLAERLQA